MPRGLLVPDVKALKDHFLRQQNGGNISGFTGPRMQRGYGLGGIFRSLARFAIPIFKQSAKVVGKRALQAATDVGNDVVTGKSISKAITSRGEEAAKDIIHQGAKSILHQSGRGKRKKRTMSKMRSAKKRKICKDYITPFNIHQRQRWMTDDESEDTSDSEDSEASTDS